MNQIDFTPPWYHDRLKVMHARQQRLVCLALTAVLMMIWLMINEGQVRQARVHLNVTYGQHQQSQVLYAKLQNLYKKKNDLHEQLRKFEHLRPALPRNIILAELSHCMPENVRLIEFTLERLDPKRDSRRSQNLKSSMTSGHEHQTIPPPKSCELKVTLIAETILEEDMAQFVRALKSSKLFHPKVVYSGTRRMEIGSDRQTVFRKNITLYIYSSEYIGP